MTTRISTASNDQGRRRHVAVCPFPFSSHPATLLQFSRKLVASAPGLNVSFFTTADSAAALSAGEDTGDVRIWRIDDGLKGESCNSPLERMGRFVEAAGDALRRSMAEAEDEVGVQIGCLVADAFLAGVCRDIAHEKAVKWVALWTSASADLMSHMYTDELRTRIQAQGGLEACKDRSVDDFIAGFPRVPVGCLAREVVAADISSSPVAQLLHQMSLILPSAAAVAVNSVHNLEPDATDALNSAFGDIFMAAGPFSLTLTTPATVAPNDPEGCLLWLETQAPASVVYISFGTALTPPEEEFQALAEALVEAGIPFIWSLPERFRAWVPEGFVERGGNGKGKVVAWAPQTSVLAHAAVGAQLTHCGWNSVTESIVSGVPLVCRALPMAEQRFNERLVVDVWGIGVAVEGGKLTRTAVIGAVEMVLGDHEGTAVRKRIREMQKLVVEAAAAESSGSSVVNLSKFTFIIING